MKKLATALGACAIALSFVGPAFAQAEPMFWTQEKLMRVTKMVNMPVYNDKNEMIGHIDDILIAAGGGEPSAILLVGSGKSMKMVKVPVSHLKVDGGKIMMPGNDGMPAGLAAMKSYAYYSGLNGGGG